MSKVMGRVISGEWSRAWLGGAASFVALVVLGCGDVPPDDQADPLVKASEAIYYGGHEYHFYVTPRSEWDAEVACSNDNMHLVTINDATEQTFLTNAESLHGGGAWWIGYTDQYQEGFWGWEDSTPNGYVNWLPGQPDNSNDEDCAADNWDGSGKWNDWNCQYGSAKFICESDSIQTSASGSFTFSVTNTNSALQNYASWAVDVPLELDPAFTIGTCDMPGAGYNGDTYLRIIDPHGQEVATNDDACGNGTNNLGSNLSVVASLAGTWVIHAGCYSTSSCNGTVAFKRQ